MIVIIKSYPAQKWVDVFIVFICIIINRFWKNWKKLFKAFWILLFEFNISSRVNNTVSNSRMFWNYDSFFQIDVVLSRAMIIGILLKHYKVALYSWVLRKSTLHFVDKGEVAIAHRDRKLYMVKLQLLVDQKRQTSWTTTTDQLLEPLPHICSRSKSYIRQMIKSFQRQKKALYFFMRYAESAKARFLPMMKNLESLTANLKVSFSQSQNNSSPRRDKRWPIFLQVYLLLFISLLMYTLHVSRIWNV